MIFNYSLHLNMRKFNYSSKKKWQSNFLINNRSGDQMIDDLWASFKMYLSKYHVINTIVE